jgi:tRNA G18 (ribose-2'-O)-methylase SpoU
MNIIKKSFLIPAFYLNKPQKRMRKLENNELERKSVADFKSSAKTPIIIVLDDVRSLHNIGSVFRTADAFD